MSELGDKIRALADEAEALEARVEALEETLRSVRSTKGDRIEDLETALRKISSEETGYEFRCDPLEYARSVIEEMREIAGKALGETDDE